MSEQPVEITIANLQLAKSAIALQANWTQGELNDEGRMCALGAVAKALSVDPTSRQGYNPYRTLNERPEVAALSVAALTLWPNMPRALRNVDSVFRFNDHKTFPEVHQMFNLAINTLKEKKA